MVEGVLILLESDREVRFDFVESGRGLDFE